MESSRDCNLKHTSRLFLAKQLYAFELSKPPGQSVAVNFEAKLPAHSAPDSPTSNHLMYPIGSQPKTAALTAQHGTIHDTGIDWPPK